MLVGRREPTLRTMATGTMTIAKRMFRPTLTTTRASLKTRLDLGKFLAGDSDWVRRDEIDAETLDASVEEECGSDAQLHEAYVGHTEARDPLNQVRRGRGFWPVMASPSPDARTATLGVRADGQKQKSEGQEFKPRQKQTEERQTRSLETTPSPQKTMSSA